MNINVLSIFYGLVFIKLKSSFLVFATYLVKNKKKKNLLMVKTVGKILLKEYFL